MPAAPQGSRSAADLHFGADVYCADGRHLGSLNFVIVDRDSFDVHAIVVKQPHGLAERLRPGASLMEDDIAIPMAKVREVERERIKLSMTRQEARRTQPYLAYRYAPVERSDMGRLLVAELGQSEYPPNLVEEAHKRLDELEISHGENVMLGRTGKKLGSVQDVVLDEGELAGIVLKPEGFFEEDVFLPVRFLGRSDDLALFAHLSERDLEHLAPFHPDEES